MKPLSSIQLLLLTLSIGIFSCSSSKYAQSGTSEYDDLYFNKSDRYPIISTNGTTLVQRTEQTDGGVGVGYNSKTLNPDYGLPQDAQAETGYSEDEYYVENHDDVYMQQSVEDYLRNNSSTARRYNSPSYNNDFDDVFWSNPSYYQGTIFDPLYRSYYGVYSPFAYRPYYRPYSSFYRPWGPGLSTSIGFGFGSYYGGYNNPFYYGGGFGYGYGYGYGSPYNRYAASTWCPPSYYGSNNNTVVINNIESTDPGNVRYGTRSSRGSSYIVNNDIRERYTADATSNSSRIRSRTNSIVKQASERTLNNARIIQSDQSGTNLRTRDTNQRTKNLKQYDQEADRSRSRFRTHSLDSRNSEYNIDRTGSNYSVQKRNRTINKSAHQTTEGKIGTRRSADRIRNHSTRPLKSSGSSRYGNSPSRKPASSGVRSRSNYSRSSSPSRAGSSNYGRSSSSGRVSSPSRSSSPSRIRSSSPAPSRSSSLPSRSSGSSVRSITRK